MSHRPERSVPTGDLPRLAWKRRTKALSGHVPLEPQAGFEPSNEIDAQKGSVLPENILLTVRDQRECAA